MSNQFFFVDYDAHFNLVITEHSTLEAAKGAGGTEPRPAIIVVFDWTGLDLKAWPVAYRNIEWGNHPARHEWADIVYSGERAQAK